MKKQDNKNDDIITEEEFENEFFEEEKKSNVIVPIIISLLVLAFSTGAMAFLVWEKINTVKQESGKESVIIERTEDTPVEEVAEATPEDTESPTPVPTRTPSPTSEPSDEDLYEGVIDYSNVQYDIKTNLSEMEAYFKENNQEALRDLAYLDRFIAMSYYFKGTSDFAYYGDINENGEPNGMGIAVYADNQYYYGEWVNGVREGFGMWNHYHIHLAKNNTDIITFHQFFGYFRNDVPDGEGQDHYEYDSDYLLANAYYITNYIGTFNNGLIDGEVYCTAIDGKDGSYEYSGTAVNGSFEYLSENRDRNKRGPVLVDKSNSDNYIWLSETENMNIGVSSYVSKEMKNR